MTLKIEKQQKKKPVTLKADSFENENYWQIHLTGKEKKREKT